MEIKTVVRVVLSAVGLLILLSMYMDGIGLEYITHQTYNALRVIGGWLFLIWIALITGGDNDGPNN